MNASTFFTRETFNSLKADIKAKKIMNYLNCPYEFTHKVKGNTYKIDVHASYYTGTNEYFYSLWIDHNYANPPYSRSQGGGTYTPSIESYEAFKEDINKVLSRFPDYTEEEQPIQMSLFDLIPQI